MSYTVYHARKSVLEQNLTFSYASPGHLSGLWVSILPKKSRK